MGGGSGHSNPILLLTAEMYVENIFDSVPGHTGPWHLNG